MGGGDGGGGDGGGDGGGGEGGGDGGEMSGGNDASAVSSGNWTCSGGSLDLGDVVNNLNKGIAIDDDSLEKCAWETPTIWPNTRVPVKTIRLFKVWGMTAPRYFHGDREKAYQGLKNFAEVYDAKFLVGISVECNKAQNDAEFAEALKFIR